MKITSIETIHLSIPYEAGGATRMIGSKPIANMEMLLVRVETDAGITGWGEAFGHAVSRATKTALDTLVAPAFIGRDPTDIAGLMTEMNRNMHIFGRNGPVVYALSGIDIALWDIAGKRSSLPLHELLGGRKRTELEVYASLRRYGDPKVVAANCAKAIERGYRQIKIHEIDVPQVKAARDAIGPDVPLMLDTNCPWTVADAITMADRFRPFDLYWLEEPVWPPEDHGGLARVRAAGHRTAAGENAAGLHDIHHMFETGSIDIAQPSVTKIGGITEVRKIVALAEAYGLTVVPHCGYFGLGYIASLHLVASLQADTPFERLYLDLEESPFSPWTEPQNGKVGVPQGPGLGCDPDMRVIEKYRTHSPTIVK
jgi:L-alanine-DL-glutamate epimerase-like enolase superfamily enzyme